MDKQQPSKDRDKAISRRQFIGTTAAAAAAFTIVPRHVLGGPGYTPPSDTLNIAGIGAGGKGRTDVRACAQTENIYALCDVDRQRAAELMKEFPKAKVYSDWRKMLEQEPGIDAVIVTTPDHTHATIAMGAMQLGKHVFVQKPLTNTIYEARMLTQAVRKYKVASQMGNQGHAGEGNRLIVEWVAAGLIGKVREVHAWTDRPGGRWAQGVDRPEGTPAVPRTLDWDVWLGPASFRPYHPAYVPFKWRGFWDFGTGSLGDMGCHIMDTPVWALKLGHPTSVVAASTPVNEESAPISSVITLEFPARGSLPPVTLKWYDGDLMPTRPPELEEGRRLGDSGGGVLLVGDKGTIMCGTYGSNPRIIPEARMAEAILPPKTIKRVESIYADWIQACKGGEPASSNFDVSGNLTEIVLLGNLALRTGQRLDWDGKNMKVTNLPEANQYVRREYRKGWQL